MKVCLINPPTTDSMERSLYFPQALLTLGGVLKENNVTCEIWDFELYFKSIRNCTEGKFRKLLRLGIDGSRNHVFGISAICSNFPMALWIAKEIKAYKPDSLVILGGAQPSSVPLETLSAFPFVDVVVVGEGEVTLAEMAREGFDREKIRDLSGLALREGNQVRMNKPRELVENMDEFPMPDYSLIDLKRYIDYDPESFIFHVEVGRGCPFKCTFCSTSLMWSRNYRVKSPARILEEMQTLHRQYGCKDFDLIHDNFTTSKKFVSDFCQLMLENDKEGLQWHIASRTDCLEIDKLETMRQAGFRSVFFGIETGSNRMQKIIGKHLNFDRFDPLLRKLHELDIRSVTAFILGFPEENIEDMDETVWRALRYRTLGARRVPIARLSALSGTDLYRNSLSQLKLPDSKDQTRPASFCAQIYGLPYINEIIRNYPELFSSYYHIPHPCMNAEELWKFIEFSQLIVKITPELAFLTMEKTGITATRLFRFWDDWAEKNHFSYCNYDSWAAIYDDFQFAFTRFVRETQFGKSLKTIPGPLSFPNGNQQSLGN